MKSVTIKHIKVLSNGTTSFSFSCLKSPKQVIFYEKDLMRSKFYIKPTKNQEFQTKFHISYKSKYKF